MALLRARENLHGGYKIGGGGREGGREANLLGIIGISAIADLPGRLTETLNVLLQSALIVERGNHLEREVRKRREEGKRRRRKEKEGVTLSFTMSRVAAPASSAPVSSKISAFVSASGLLERKERMRKEGGKGGGGGRREEEEEIPRAEGVLNIADKFDNVIEGLIEIPRGVLVLRRLGNDRGSSSLSLT